MRQEGAPSARLVVAEHRLVEFADVGQRLGIPGKVGCEEYQPVHVPGEQSLWRGTKVVLLAHTVLNARRPCMPKLRRKGKIEAGGGPGPPATLLAAHARLAPPLSPPRPVSALPVRTLLL